jgi:hypothetical protein
MATKRETPLERVQKRRGIKTTSPTTASSNKLENQVKNYKTRLGNIGVDAEEVTDNRNFLEKALNLEKDQNVLFDIFEILDRPRNALFTGVQNALEGESIGEGLWEGFSGQRETSGKDILVDNFGMYDEEGKLNLSDVLGFGLDVVADPTDWALFGGKSALQKVAQGAGKAIKKTAGVTDNVIEASLKGLDNLKEGSNKLGVYKDLKKGAKNIIDSASNVKGFIGRSKMYDSEKELSNLIGRKTLSEIKTNADEIAKNMGISTDELMTKAVNAIESNRNWDLTGKDIIKRFDESKTIDLLTPKQASDVKNALDSFGIKTSLDSTGRKLTLDEGNMSKLFTIQDAPYKESIFKDTIFGSRNYDEINKLLKADREFFNRTPELQNLYNSMENAVKKHADLVSDKAKGLIPGEEATTDYAKHSLTDETRKRSKEKGFKAREAANDASIAQVNRMKEEERLLNLAKEEEALDRANKSIYKTELDEAGNEVLVKDANGKYILDDTKYQEKINRKQNLVNSLEKSIASNEQVLKYAKGENINKNLLNKKGQKAVSVIDKRLATELEVETLSKEIKEHLEQIKNLKDITPDAVDSLENLSKTYNEFSKRFTELKNTMPKVVNKVKKGTLDELGGYLTSNEQVKHTFEPLLTLRNKLREELTVSKATFDDTFRKAVKEQVSNYQTGKELGESLSKKTASIKANANKIKLIKETTSESLVNANRKLNFQKQALENLKTDAAKSNYIQKALDSIKHHTEQIELLKSQEGQQFFKIKFDEVFTDYVKAASEQNAGTKKFYDALANNLFDNDEYIRVHDGGKTPFGYTKVNGNSLIKKYEGYKAIMTDDGKELGEVLNKFKNKELIMDSQFATALNVASKGDKELAPLLKVWNGVNNAFKKFSTLTPGFHIRNIVGNSTNMALSGMNPSQIPEYWAKARNIWNNADDLVAKYAKGALNADEAKQFDILKQFYEGGFADALKKGYGLEEVSDAVKEASKNPISKASNWSIDFNNKVDAYNRLALLMYANDNPKYLAKLGKDNAIDAVKYVLFDPNNISDAEQAIKRAIPFYTFTKQNLFFQASNLMKNTGKYKKLYKGFQNSYDDLDENAYYEYQKQGMQIPLPIQDSEGNQLFLKANLPVSDLGEFLENPVQRIVSSTSPLIKTPFERVTGVDTFTGQELHLDTLSGITDKLGIDSGGARNTAQLAEHILKNFGLSNVSTNLVKKVQTALEYGAGNISGQELWSEIFRSVLQNTNEENVRNSGLYDELEAYQAEIKRLKNQGIDVPTIKEITASNNIKLNNLKNKRAKSK